MTVTRKRNRVRVQQQPPPPSNKKPSAADFLASPPPDSKPQPTPSGFDTPKTFKFNLNSSPQTETAVTNTRRRNVSTVNASPKRRLEAVASMAELKELASSRLASIKRQTERSHADILKEVESSKSRLNKRFKIQTQACQQLVDETDKAFKKMSERIAESTEAMKVSYAEFLMEAQTTLSRVCKTSIPEKVESFEKAIDALRNRYVM